MTEQTERWYKADYLSITAATYQEGRLHVRFADESEAVVEAARVVAEPQLVCWDSLHFNEREVVASTRDGGTVEIPWSTIRVLTDRAFSAHLAIKAAEQARRIGARLRALREARGLTGKELALRAGITPQSLSRIEHGQHDVVFRTLQRLLTAMGYSLRDLAMPAPPQPASGAENGRVVANQ